MHSKGKNEADSSRRDAPIHRIGMKVVSHEEWLESQGKQGRYYEKNKKRELDREFDKNQKLEWKGGLEQTTERERRAEDAVDIASEPLSRFGKSSNRESKQQRRWDDPMDAMRNTSDDNSVKPKCIFQAPANRFGIPAGYRWDGVVRGNNFEQKWFERLNDLKHKDSYRLD